MGVYGEQNIFCPFYKCLDKQQIKCEGFFEKSSVAISAQDLKDIKNWLKKYCTTNEYKKCPIAKMLDDKYK